MKIIIPIVTAAITISIFSMILPIATNAETSVAWDKYVRRAHAYQPWGLPIVMVTSLTRPMIPPIADNAVLLVLRDHPAVVAVAPPSATALPQA